MAGVETARFFAHDSRPLQGTKQVVPIAAPPAGQDWTVRVPPGEQWWLITGRAQLVTSAAVANRVPAVQLTTDGTLTYEMQDGAAVVAATTVAYTVVCASSPVPVSHQGVRGIIHVPQLWLPSQATINSITAAIDVADQWSNINLWVERYYHTDQELQIHDQELVHEYLGRGDT